MRISVYSPSGRDRRQYYTRYNQIIIIIITGPPYGAIAFLRSDLCARIVRIFEISKFLLGKLLAVYGSYRIDEKNTFISKLWKINLTFNAIRIGRSDWTLNKSYSVINKDLEIEKKHKTIYLYMCVCVYTWYSYKVIFDIFSRTF